MSPTLFTIGYEKSNIDDFLATLLEHGIKTLIDVRDHPFSRKKYFSKNRLGLLLNECGISYIHLKGLGDPKDGRLAARAGHIADFQRIYRKKLDSTEGVAALNAAIDILVAEKSCLLCFERDPRLCHRTIVAKEIAQKLPITVKQIGVQAGLPSLQYVKDTCQFNA